ncbi:histidine triad nucleotide-binding protein [Candidatus Odyssella thessalonicensis]|uniref:histidine triad nucleotide-binding protein n=1 Tax=Candidatus Odyssella thessalonicensis TaxID=84647 RepID=UPI000225A914|nr:histidine triad nucleotide-binding protein [Candidatus Odyssella thessalonicensis]
MSYDVNNIFARILRQEIPCKKVFEDEKILAFHDICPRAPIHILIIPKGEYISFHDFHSHADAETVAHFYQKVAEIAAEFKLDEAGYRVIANCGLNGGQEVPHYHLHLLGGTKLGGF